MARNAPTMHDWLDIAGPMLRDLLPPGAGLEMFGHGMPPAEFAALVERECARVDQALCALAMANGEQAVFAIAGQLSRDTLIALFSRWVQCMERWRLQAERPDTAHWMPSSRGEIWRAVFLSMTTEGIHSTAAARALWPEVFAAPTAAG